MKKILIILLTSIACLNTSVAVDIYNTSETVNKTIKIGGSVVVYYSNGPKGPSSMFNCNFSLGIIEGADYVKVSSYTNESRPHVVIRGLKEGFSRIRITSYYPVNGADMNGSHTRFIHVDVVKKVEPTQIVMQESINLNIGETVALTPTIYPANAEYTLRWSSSNSSIATINNGTITAISPGSTNIECTTDNGLKAVCTAIINPIIASSISLNIHELALTSGDSSKLTATLKPSNVSSKKIKWETSDNNVAIVNSSGNIYAVSKGVAYISATTTDGSDLTDFCIIKVTEPSSIATHEIEDAIIDTIYYDFSGKLIKNPGNGFFIKKEILKSGIIRYQKVYLTD